MNALWLKYRSVLEQCFIPIFVQDTFDTETLLQGCDLAGISVLEYTLRREDAHQVIPMLKKRYPNRVIFAGSTIDDETIAQQMRRHHPQLMSIPQLAPYVDGFVSMLPFSDETLRRYRSSHLLIPSAETSGEALRQVKNGATVIKVCGPDLALAKKMHAAPTFNYCPTFFTGGATLDRMEEIFCTGNLLTAAGFDLILKGEPPHTLTPERVAVAVSNYVRVAQEMRATVCPLLANPSSLSDQKLMDALPNYCSVNP